MSNYYHYYDCGGSSPYNQLPIIYEKDDETIDPIKFTASTNGRFVRLSERSGERWLYFVSLSDFDFEFISEDLQYYFDYCHFGYTKNTVSVNNIVYYILSIKVYTEHCEVYDYFPQTELETLWPNLVYVAFGVLDSDSEKEYRVSETELVSIANQIRDVADIREPLEFPNEYVNSLLSGENTLY